MGAECVLHANAPAIYVGCGGSPEQRVLGCATPPILSGRGIPHGSKTAVLETSRKTVTLRARFALRSMGQGQ